MAERISDEAAAGVAAMQFAGGMSIERVAELWDRDRGWVEEAIRAGMLAEIPIRDGGTKPTRVEARAERKSVESVKSTQQEFWWFGG